MTRRWSQAWTNAVVRAGRWIHDHSPDEVYEAVEPFVGSTSRAANLIEIAGTKAVDNPGGLIAEADFEHGAKVWFREMTGVAPVKLSEVLCRRIRAQGERQVSRLMLTEAAAHAAAPAFLARAASTCAASARRFSSTAGASTRCRTSRSQVREGEFVALLGPSGSGKSTVLNMIATLLAPTSGEALIDGRAVVPGRTTPQVGYVYQKDTLFPWRTVADNIGYGLELAGMPAAERRARVEAAVARVGLRGFENAYPSSLSGGMRQRAALMRTLVKEPEILLMDEPFGALDTHTKLDMHDVLLRIWEREQQTVLFVTHDLGEALTLADRIILFSARPGRIKDVFPVDFPRPRDGVALRETPAYAALFSRVWHSLGEEFAKGRSA